MSTSRSIEWYEAQCKYPLEQELYKRDVRLFIIYYDMKEELADNYYQYIDYKCPWFTDHGIKHCEQILFFAGNMLSKNLPYVHNKRGRVSEGKLKLSNYDIFVLLSSIIWHDIGMLLGRDEHGVNISHFYGVIDSFVKDAEMSKSIANIAAAHSSNDYFHVCQLINSFNVKSGVARIQEKLLAAILRLADEVSETKHRVSNAKHIEKSIPPEQLIYWDHAKSICLSEYETEKEEIAIRYQIPWKKTFLQYKIIEKDGSESKISLYDFIITRICKVYRELELCTPFFRDHLSVKKYRAAIVFQYIMPKTKAIKESRPIEAEIDFLGYTKDSPDTIKSFFHYYPDFDPKNVSSVIENFTKGIV